MSHVVALVPEVGCKGPGRATLLIEVGSKEPCCSLRFWVRWEANSRGGGAAALEFWVRGGKGARRGVAALVFLGEVGCKKARVCCSPVMPSQVDQRPWAGCDATAEFGVRREAKPCV